MIVVGLFAAAVAAVALPWLVWLHEEGADLRSLRRWHRVWSTWERLSEEVPRGR